MLGVGVGGRPGPNPGVLLLGLQRLDNACFQTVITCWYIFFCALNSFEVFDLHM